MKNKPKLDTKMIAKVLRAEHRGKVEAGGGHFGAMQLVAESSRAFRCRRGEVALPTRTGRRDGWFLWPRRPLRG